MEITNLGNRSDSVSSVRITHGAEYIDFPMSTYSSTALRKPEALFANVNKWLSRCGADQQQDIFNAYKEINSILNDDIEYVDAVDYLIVEIKNLYDVINPEAVSDWLRIHGTFAPPLDLNDQYGQKDTPVLTYLRHEYLEVMLLCEILRFILPVWGAFIKHYAKTVGTDWKELAAYNLLDGSVIPELPSMVRLVEYMENTLKNVPVNMAAVFSNLASSEMIKFQTAIAVVRKVAIGETSTPDVHVIKNVSNSARSNTKSTQLDRKFIGDGRLVDKHPPTERKDSPDNTSIVETYKIKQEQPDSEFIAAAKSLEDHKLIARRICPDIPLRLIDVCVKFVLTETPVVTVGRRQLAAMAVHHAIEPEFLPAMDNIPTWRCMGIAMAVFTHMGYPDVAALLTAKLNDHQVSLIASSSINSNIPKDVYLELDKLYYSDHAGKVTVAAKKQNPAYTTIIDILSELGKYSLEINLPERVLETQDVLIQGNNIPSEIPLGVKIAELFIKLH